MLRAPLEKDIIASILRLFAGKIKRVFGINPKASLSVPQALLRSREERPLTQK
jgi:hypothetical protein